MLGSVILEWFLHLKIRIDGKGKMQLRCLLNTFGEVFLGMSYRKEIQGKTHQHAGDMISRGWLLNASLPSQQSSAGGGGWANKQSEYYSSATDIYNINVVR